MKKKSIAQPKAVASKITPQTKAPAKPTTQAAKVAPKAAPAKTTTAATTAAVTADKTAEIEELNSKLSKLRDTIQGLEKERNFYFGKLRSIEVLCQQDETKDAETKAQVLKILYQTDSEEEFQAPAATETGEVAAQGEVAAEVSAEVSADLSSEPVAEIADGDLLASGSAEETF